MKWFEYEVRGVERRQRVQATNIADAAAKAHRVWGDDVVAIVDEAYEVMREIIENTAAVKESMGEAS
jgi:hypothetical protein